METGNSLEEYIENAITWAKDKLGSEHYRGLCLAFVEDAYEKSNGVEIFGGDTAKESAIEYQADKRIGVPLKGAFVFYDCYGEMNSLYKNWGHVGLAIETGKVIHAWDVVRIDNYLDVERLVPPEGWTKPKYIGWVPVERIFERYRIV
jgi:hypothetical protein